MPEELHPWKTQCVTLCKTLFGFLCKVDLRFAAEIIIKRVSRMQGLAEHLRVTLGQGHASLCQAGPVLAFLPPTYYSKGTQSDKGAF